MTPLNSFTYNLSPELLSYHSQLLLQWLIANPFIHRTNFEKFASMPNTSISHFINAKRSMSFFNFLKCLHAALSFTYTSVLSSQKIVVTADFASYIEEKPLLYFELFRNLALNGYLFNEYTYKPEPNPHLKIFYSNKILLLNPLYIRSYMSLNLDNLTSLFRFSTSL